MPSLKLNSSIGKGEKQDINSPKVTEMKNVSLTEADVYEKAKQRLYDEFIQDMSESAMDATVSEEQILEAKKRYNQLKMKRNVLFVALVSTFVLITFFGVYNTFLKHELTFEEIVYIANAYNGRTNFPDDGVQGYLSTNVPSLLRSKFIGDNDIREVSVSLPVLSKISHKGNQYANVYFYVNVTTNRGEERLDCMVPLYWDVNDWSYSLAGDIMFTPSYPVDRSVEVVDNPYLSFSDISKANDDEISMSKTFVDNFFSFLYGGKDVSPYYSGEQLNTGDLMYVGMVDYTLYNSTNMNGYNAICDIQLKTSNGLMYSTTKYILIERSGNSWIIKNVL